MTDKKIKVCVYTGGYNLIKKSGVGKAICHQITILKKSGVSVNEKRIKNADILHINSVFPDSVFAALYAKLHGVRVIWYGHSTMEDFRNSFAGSDFFAPAFKKWITFCYNLADIIITPTVYSKSVLSGYRIKKPVIALSNGINTDYWHRIHPDSLNETGPESSAKRAFLRKFHIPQNRPFIMSVGHYMKRKGLPEFIALAEKHPEMTFVWFGYTPPVLVTSSVKRAIRKAPDNVIFAGYSDRHELRAAYSFCDLFLFMSHEETEGIVVLEALSCSALTAVRDIPVYKSFLKNGLNGYKFKSEDDLEDILKKALSSFEQNAVLRKNARKTALHKNFKAVGKKMEIIYGRLLK